MKTLNLILPDWAYYKAAELAQNLGVSDQAYVSTMVVENLSNKGPNQTKNTVIKPIIDDVAPASALGPTLSTAPDCLQQVIMVCTHVYENNGVPTNHVHCNQMYKMAVRMVANKLGIRETTVRDKCSTDRRLGPADVPINQATFINWLCNPVSLQEHLCKRFPEYRAEIRQFFANWVPGPSGAIV